MATRSLSMSPASTRSEGGGFAGRLAARLIDSVGTWARRRRNRSALAELSQRQLADIGLSRTAFGYCPLDDGPLDWKDLGRRL